MVVRGSVTPGIRGIRGGKDRDCPKDTNAAAPIREYFIANNVDPEETHCNWELEDLA